jgi:hypothetical protein
MNEFKFSCPHCQQNIQATPEYAGVQITCPSCQTAIVVPQPSEAAAPRPGKLTKAPSTVQHAATSPVMATTMIRIRKAKKSRVGLYVGLGVGAVAVVAGIIFVPKLLDKYNQHKEEVAAAQAAANAPPPPPPEPTADQILKKVGAAYKGLSSYSAQGESVGVLDMSAVNPALKEPLHPTARLSILLGRGGNHYRIEWERQLGSKSIKGATWSAGKGDFFRTGTAATKMKDWQTALNTATAASGTLGMSLAELFFDATNSMAVVLKNYSKTNNETLDGSKCYVLTGKVSSQNMLLWIHKDDFLIAQAELVLGGKLDDSELAGLTAAQKAQAQMISKVKGNIVETYADIETNKVLNDADFQVAATPAAFPPMTKKPKEPKPRKQPQ